MFTQQQLAAGILTNLDPIVAPPLPLNNGEVTDLVEFLQALSDPGAGSAAPTSVPSGLPVGN